MLKQARDVTPYNHTYNGIQVVSRKWSDDGTDIVFMLDNHTFMFSRPNDNVTVEECCQGVSKKLWAKILADDAEVMANRPIRDPKCTGKGTESCRTETP